jgi:hypothetical protein
MTGERTVIVAAEAGIAIRSARDINDVIGACFGAAGIIFDEADLAPEFFDLRTGWAGELFQKLVNYGLRAAIVVPDPAAYSKRLQELAYEHRTHPAVRFVPSRADADAWLGA